MERLLFFLCCILFTNLFSFSQKKIICIGASITEGALIENPKENSFPGQLQSLLGSGYVVSNFGVSSATILKNGDFSYWKTNAYQMALKSEPDIVFIDLGGNDAKKLNQPYYGELENDTRDMIRSFTSLTSRPRVVLMLPVPSFETDENQIWDERIRQEITPRLQKACYEEDIEFLDMYQLLTGRPDLYSDKIHPNKDGSAIMAKRLYEQMNLNFDNDYNISRNLNLDYDVSDYHGYKCFDFTFEGRKCKVAQPQKAQKDRPWIWRARFWGHEPQAEIALLERGFHVAYCDVAEMMGNKESIEIWNDFYHLLVSSGLSKKVVLEGMSRGAVYALNWSAVNPDKVAAVYIDNPLLDCKSMFKNKAGEDKPHNEVSLAILESYGLERKNIAGFKESPVDKIDEIVKGNYPVLILCAELDEAVDNDKNTFLFAKKMRDAGGDVLVIEKKAFGHHPHSFPNPSVIVDFILKAYANVQIR